MGNSSLIEAHGICKFYAGRIVLHEVSLRIARGEIVTIVGPNGAGKTTLLNCLLGLETPDHGHVLRSADLRIGYMPQHFTPLASMPMTVAYFLKLYGMQASAVTDSLANELGIAALMKAQMRTLSGGELRRVLLMRALLKNPNLLVLDEPTSGVDVSGQSELYRLLKRLSEARGFAMVMVSHDLYVVMAAAERVICLNHHICCEGTPQHIGGDASFRAMFGDSFADQIALYHHHHTHQHGLADADYPHSDQHVHHGCNHG